MKDDREVIINEYKELVRRQAEEINRLDAKIVKLMEENERLQAALDLAKLPPINTPAPSNPPWPSTPPWLPADPKRPWWEQPGMVVPCTYKEPTIKEAGDSGV